MMSKDSLPQQPEQNPEQQLIAELEGIAPRTDFSSESSPQIQTLYVDGDRKHALTVNNASHEAFVVVDTTHGHQTRFGISKTEHGGIDVSEDGMALNDPKWRDASREELASTVLELISRSSREVPGRKLAARLLGRKAVS